jgi:tetratricopeptide (TPR) repeat protein
MLRLSEANLDTAVTLDSTLAGAWAELSESRRLRGEFNGAKQAAERALRADPFLADAAAVVTSAWLAAFSQADTHAAAQWCDRGRAMAPGDWRFVECELTNLRLDAAGVSQRRPNPARAWALVKILETMDPSEHARDAGRPYSPFYRRLSAAAVSAAAGDTRTARRVLSAELFAVQNDAELRTDILYDAALIHLTLGERDQARASLNSYARARPDFAGLIRLDPTLRGAIDSR